MGRCCVLMLVLPALLGVGSVQGLKIKVLDSKGNVAREFTDSSAVFQDRSYLLPDKENDAIIGLLVYPNPRNACSTAEVSPNDTFIAYVTEYNICPGQSESNLKTAEYAAMLAYTSHPNTYLRKTQLLPQALIMDSGFDAYLRSNVIQETNVSAPLRVVIWDDSFAKLEQLFIVFGVILMVAIFLSIFVFCSSLFCRVALVRWRTRGLSSWQVRALPKRKFRKVKESTDTCSICLEEFKEGETVRVLPCDHVFHPKCVDEWLQKWNRTCPLCKSTIKRKGGRTHNPPAQTDDNETSLLLPQDQASAADEDHTDGAIPGDQYGSTGVTTVMFRRGRHQRGSSGGASSHASSSDENNKQQVTSAEIELSAECAEGGRVDGRASAISLTFHTPLHSDEEDNTPSFATAHTSIDYATERV